MSSLESLDVLPLKSSVSYMSYFKSWRSLRYSKIFYKLIFLNIAEYKLHINIAKIFNMITRKKRIWVKYY
jgi:hypothetical protein